MAEDVRRTTQADYLSSAQDVFRGFSPLKKKLYNSSTEAQIILLMASLNDADTIELARTGFNKMQTTRKA